MPLVPSPALTRPRTHTVPVAIYTRVSTANQVGGRFDSCDSQAAVCRDHIAKQSADGWFEVACYSDPAYSGGTMNRPGIRALMRHIETAEVKIVLILNWSVCCAALTNGGRSARFSKNTAASS